MHGKTTMDAPFRADSGKWTSRLTQPVGVFVLTPMQVRARRRPPRRPPRLPSVHPLSPLFPTILRVVPPMCPPHAAKYFSCSALALLSRELRAFCRHGLGVCSGADAHQRRCLLAVFHVFRPWTPPWPTITRDMECMYFAAVPAPSFPGLQPVSARFAAFDGGAVRFDMCCFCRRVCVATVLANSPATFRGFDIECCMRQTIDSCGNRTHAPCTPRNGCGGTVCC